jgi:nucleoside-diphosphate kinase
LLYTNVLIIKENSAMEQTLSIIKPDAVSKGVIGKIIDRFEENGLRVAAMKKIKLSSEDAGAFYAVHKERPFFGELVEFMTSGPVVVMVLEGENAVVKNRELMGATNPKEAAKGTIRADFATSIDANAVHGSDSLENAKIEINFFFSGQNIH